MRTRMVLVALAGLLCLTVRPALAQNPPTARSAQERARLSAASAQAIRELDDAIARFRQQNEAYRRLRGPQHPALVAAQNANAAALEMLNQVKIMYQHLALVEADSLALRYPALRAGVQGVEVVITPGYMNNVVSKTNTLISMVHQALEQSQASTTP